MVDGRPMVKIGTGTILENSGTLITGSLSVSSAISHEICESKKDPYCSFYSTWSSPEKKVSLEVCDPVEGDFYNISVSDGSLIAVSNFVGVRWFDANGEGPYDFMGKISAPLTMSPGGYLAFDDGTQIYGDLMPEWKRQQKRLFSRRTPWR